MNFDENIWPAFCSKLKPETALKYRIIYNEFFEFVGKKPIYLCSTNDAFDYDKWLTMRENIRKPYASDEGKKLSISHSTHYARISVMRSLCSFIEKLNYYEGFTNPFSSIVLAADNAEVSYYDMPTLEDLDMLLAAARENQSDFCMYTLIIKCALSTKQICNLKQEHLFEDESGQLVLKLKDGHYEHFIALPLDVTAVLRSYAPPMTTEYLFCNKWGKPLTEKTLQRNLKKYLSDLQDKLINKDFTIQQIRHASIAYMKAGGASDEDVANYLNLATVSNFSRYNKVSNEASSHTADYSILSVHADSV